ncbi:hypothetical protein RISK_005148 [Rhodopirellula islandica]|uniref:Uncharacterized protein n=1 Tax=Rhodopirellula islandica TaxID=595434 RepID=A0A0J1B7Z6_RHOIS|nr:hypothetical protein RISK_005148 [Rhodopirellula islandica]
MLDFGCRNDTMSGPAFLMMASSDRLGKMRGHVITHPH